MSRRTRRTFIAAGDNHVPHHNPQAEAVLLSVVRRLKPDLFVHLGDGLDCGQFSAHPPTHGVEDTQFEDDLKHVNQYLDHIQKYSGYTAYLAGNHEWRIERWAAMTTEGRGAYSMISPRISLSRGRKKFTYVNYGSSDGTYCHYKINSRIVAVHGWSYAKNATHRHLEMSPGKSVIHGHTHRIQTSVIQDVWDNSRTIEARSGGCMCNRIPLYGTGTPVEWSNGIILGYLGGSSDTLYTVIINGDHCILPDGTEVKA